MGYEALTTLFDRVEQWAQERNLIEGSKPKDQFTKLIEEVGELAAAIARFDPENDPHSRDKILDAIGDCFVVLIILAQQYDLHALNCLQWAYLEIKDRKGRMVDGVFVKEGEGDGI